MTRDQFEQIAEELYNELPAMFTERIENVHIRVEDYPSEDVLRRVRAGKTSLLGLYQGIPLTKRDSWYGTSPTTPDTISLYQKNIEAGCRTEQELRGRIREVLFHEIGHYFGMSESEIRNAMKNMMSSH